MFYVRTIPYKGITNAIKSNAKIILIIRGFSCLKIFLKPNYCSPAISIEVSALLFKALVMPYVWKSPYIEHVSYAVLDEDNSALSRKITELVKTNNYVDVNYYPSSEDELEKAIKKGKVYGNN